jgi:hypothetical protein
MCCALPAQSWKFVFLNWEGYLLHKDYVEAALEYYASGPQPYGGEYAPELLYTPNNVYTIMAGLLMSQYLLIQYECAPAFVRAVNSAVALMPAQAVQVRTRRVDALHTLQLKSKVGKLCLHVSIYQAVHHGGLSMSLHQLM